jgi:hypothetical protein
MAQLISVPKSSIYLSVRSDVHKELIYEFRQHRFIAITRYWGNITIKIKNFTCETEDYDEEPLEERCQGVQRIHYHAKPTLLPYLNGKVTKS